jgi:hypothetical protein
MRLDRTIAHPSTSRLLKNASADKITAFPSERSATSRDGAWRREGACKYCSSVENACGTRGRGYLVLFVTKLIEMPAFSNSRPYSALRCAAYLGMLPIGSSAAGRIQLRILSFNP